VNLTVEITNGSPTTLSFRAIFIYREISKTSV